MRLNTFSGNGNRYDFTISPNYNSKTFDSSLIFNGIAQGLQSGDSLYFTVLDKNGNLVSDLGSFTTSSTKVGVGFPAQSTYYSTYSGSVNMGVQGQSYNPNWSSSYIYEDYYYLQTSIKNNLYLTSTNTFYGIVADCYPKLPQGTAYPKAPITFSRGDHVIYGTVSTVENKNKVTLSLDSNSAADLSGNGAGYVNGIFMQRSIVDAELPASGQYTVIRQDLNNSVVYVDGDVTSMSGAFVKIKPRPTISSYSGWTDVQNVQSKLTFDTALATGQGRWNATITSVGSYDNYDVGVAFLGAAPSLVHTPRLNLVIEGDSLNRTLKVGDHFEYESSTSPGTFIKALVLTRNAQTLGISGDITEWALGVVSGDAPTVGTTGTVLPFADYRINNYPNFGEDVTAVLYGTASGETATQMLMSDRVRMPSADFEVIANDYDSSFGTISESAHFHLGSVKLSNGQVLRSDDLKLSAALYSSDPTDTSPISTWTIWGTQNPNAAEQYSGNFVRGGVYTKVYENVFDSAQVLHLSGTFSLGTATVERTFDIPVQPNS